MQSGLHTSCANWTAGEFAAAGRALLRGSARQARCVSQLRGEFETRYRCAGAFALNSGRAAIRLALEELRRHLPNRRNVIVPAYICPSVPEAVRAAGLHPTDVGIGADLNLSLAELARGIDEGTLAVIAPHMYGCPLAIQEMEHLCAQRGIFLIDDAAQVVGVSVAGRPLGSFGDFGIVSFAQSKTIVTGVSGSGGMLLVNRREYLEGIAAEYSTLPRSSGRVVPYLQFALDHLLEPVSPTLAYYLLRGVQRLKSETPEANLATASKISGFESAIALRQLGRLDQIIADRIRIAGLYNTHIDLAHGFSFPQFAAGRFLTRIMLMAPAGLPAVRIRESLRDEGIRIRIGYPARPGDRGDAMAEAASIRLIEAPSNPGMSESSVRRFCKILGTVNFPSR